MKRDNSIMNKAVNEVSEKDIRKAVPTNSFTSLFFSRFSAIYLVSPRLNPPLESCVIIVVKFCNCPIIAIPVAPMMIARTLLEIITRNALATLISPLAPVTFRKVL